jgi:nucleoid-associated protein YgaU
MGQDIIVGVLALAFTILPLNVSGSVENIPTVEKPEIVEVVVKPGDSLSLIAEEEYGSGDFWTNIWNENSNIKDPSLIEKGDKIKISAEKPEKPAELKDELKKRIEAKKLALATATPAPQTESNEGTKHVNQPATPVTYSGGPLSQEQINYLGNCESGMTASRNSGNGYFGAFQFSPATWRSMGTAYERADLAPLEVQIDAVQRLVQRSSIFTQFPGCASKMRSLGIL